MSKVTQQKSLFSFFTKAQSAVGSDRPSPSLKVIESSPGDEDTVIMKRSTLRYKRHIVDDDDEEFNEAENIKMAGKLRKIEVLGKNSPSHDDELFNGDESFDDELDDASSDSQVTESARKSAKKRATALKSLSSKKNTAADQSKSIARDKIEQKSPLAQRRSPDKITPSPSIHSEQAMTPTFDAGLTSYNPQKSVLSIMSTPLSNTPTSVAYTTPSSGVGDLDQPMREGVLSGGCHDHHGWDFLHSKRKDKDGLPPSNPNFNPRTLSLPSSFFKEQTPAMRQWFEFKSENMDTVLFFKVGKFYELYHMDADVGVKELDLVYMRGSKAHSGFPEISYGKYSSILVSRGYRVARIEQTETPDMLKERNRTAAKGSSSKVVMRELCCVMSKGTRTFGHLDDLAGIEEAGDGQVSSVLCCLKERILASRADGCTSDIGVVEYGVCLVDTMLGSITLAQFEDDAQRNRLRTLLSRYLPTEVVVQGNAYSPETSGVVKLLVPGALFETLRGDEFPTAESVVDGLRDTRYFCSETCSQESRDSWPDVLRLTVEGFEESNRVSAPVLEAFGAALWTLRRSLIDHEIVSLGRMYCYVPPDESQHASSQVSADKPQFFRAETSSQSSGHWTDPESILSLAGSELTNGNMEVGDMTQSPKHMVLDAVALANLEIFMRAFDLAEKGSLWQFINRSKTAFGRRLLRSWLSNPLFRVHDIQRRMEAVEQLLDSLSAEADAARTLLRNIPDLERLLARVHSSGIRRSAINHPDSRAIMFDECVYNAKKIRDFADCLGGFETLLKVMDIFKDAEISSDLLARAVAPTNDDIASTGRFPMKSVRKLLSYYREVFDEKQAKRDGMIRPRDGVNPEYDRAKQEVQELESSFENYLVDMKKRTGIVDLKYFGTNKDRFQLEVPMTQCSKAPRDWTSKSQKKTHRRYWTPFITEHLALLIEAENRVSTAQKDTLRSIFEKFDKSRAVWSAAVSCAALLDALLALAAVSGMPGYVWPTLLTRTAGSSPKLHIVKGRHPMLEQSLAERGDGTEYIPNDLSLGGDRPVHDHVEYLPRMLLLSGPNMGGKSTLLRQTCLIVILAQIGCRVPAEECELSPVDRIFTRVGASDRILAGQSTFFVELSETASVIRSATEDSLCILDELGRGTATFDGTAIAHAVAEHLISRIRCRSLFATHYHSLVEDWAVDVRVRLGHMDCLVQGKACEMDVLPSEDDLLGMDGSGTDDKDEVEEVTFLYRLCDGSCPKSYGINVARLAHLPSDVISRAINQSKAFQARVNGSSGSVDGKTSRHGYGVISMFFEKLVSIAQSGIEGNELYYIAVEMWKRYNHVEAVANM